MTSARPAPPGDLVLVVGAAHIDVIADYDSRVEARMDKSGEVRYSIGGTAYNIAVNLGQYGVPTALMTVLKQPSFSSVWVRERLYAARVRTDFVDASERVHESGFVALRSDGNLVSAVTSSAVEQHTFGRDRIDQAIKRARIVVLDCNLAPEQISVLAEAAQEAGRAVVVAAVSDTKVRRIGDTLAKPYDLVCLNELEARASGIDTTTLLDPAHAAASCALLRARYVVVTLGADGHRVLSAAGGVATCPAPAVDTIVSTSGAGDALLSGIVAHAYKHGALDPVAAQGIVSLLVRKVLGQTGATVGSLAVDADYARLAKIALREEPWSKRLLTQEVGVAVTVLSLVFGGVQIWYAKRAVDDAALATSQAASAAFASASDAAGKRAIAEGASAPASSASAARPASAAASHGKP